METNVYLYINLKIFNTKSIKEYFNFQRINENNIYEDVLPMKPYGDNLYDIPIKKRKEYFKILDLFNLSYDDWDKISNDQIQVITSLIMLSRLNIPYNNIEDMINQICIDDLNLIYSNIFDKFDSNNFSSKTDYIEYYNYNKKNINHKKFINCLKIYSKTILVEKLIC